MDTLIATIMTVFERECVLTFLDQFDKIVFEMTFDVKSYIAENAPKKFKESMCRYFEIDIDQDPQVLFTKSRDLRNQLLQLDSLSITAPLDLEEEFIDKLGEWIKSVTDRPVLLDIKKDPYLIGGAVVGSQGFILEHSFRAFFEKRKDARRAHGL